MSSSPVDRVSDALTPVLAVSSSTTNRLHEQLIGLKRWRQMYDSAMKEKNEELQKLQLINQRQTQAFNDSIIQIEQQTMTIHSMKQNEALLEKKVIRLEELHNTLKKNMAKLEKTVSQCEFVCVDLERMYEHQERSVKSLAHRVDSTIETKLRNLQSQLKVVEQLHEQARIELQQQVHQRTEENAEFTAQISELKTKLTTVTSEMKQLQMINTNTQSKANKLTDEINKYRQMIEVLSAENQSMRYSKDQQVEDLQKRIDLLVLKIKSHKTEIFHLQEINQILQTRMNEMNEKPVENHQSDEQTRQTDTDLLEKENERLKTVNHQLIEQMINRDQEINELKTKNQSLQNEINELNLDLRRQLNETREQFQKQIDGYPKQSVEHDNRFEQHNVEMNKKEKILKDLKMKYDQLVEKMELSEEEITQLSKENEELRVQNYLLLQETDERNEQVQRKEVIVDASNIEVDEKEKEIGELRVKVTVLEKCLFENQNLLTLLRSSMNEKAVKIKCPEQGPTSFPPVASPPATAHRTVINHTLAMQTESIPSPIRPPLPPSVSMNQQKRPNIREKRMLPSAAVNDLTMTPTKIPRLNQTKATIDQGHAPEKPTTPVSDDDRDETASNTSVASLFEYLKGI